MLNDMSIAAFDSIAIIASVIISRGIPILLYPYLIVTTSFSRTYRECFIRPIRGCKVDDGARGSPPTCLDPRSVFRARFLSRTNSCIPRFAQYFQAQRHVPLPLIRGTRGRGRRIEHPLILPAWRPRPRPRRRTSRISMHSLHVTSTSPLFAYLHTRRCIRDACVCIVHVMRGIAGSREDFRPSFLSLL